MVYKSSIFGVVPEDWTVNKIGEIAQLRQGLQISSNLRINEPKEDYIPLLKIRDLPKKNFTEFVTNIKENYIAKKDDIIYTRTGQVGLVYTDVIGCVHNNCFKVMVDYNEFDKYYIYYYLNNPIFKEYANSIASGSVQKDLTHSSFKTVPIAYPNIQKQKRIGNILKSLDEKIELNNQITSNLEELAQTLFKRWFIDFEFPNEEGEPYRSSGGKMVESEFGLIPEGWKVITIKDVCDANKSNLSKKDNWSYINYLDTSNITENSIKDMKFIDTIKDKIPSRAKRKVHPNDIVYSTVRPNQLHYGIVKKPIENMIASTGFTVLSSKGKYSNDLIYLWLTQETVINNLQGIAEQSTSAYPSIKADDILSLKILLPTQLQLDMLTKIVDVQNNLIWNKQQENNKLSKLRNTLLPKLLSGEIEIPAENEVMDDVPV